MNIPNVTDELNRKTLETIQNLLALRQAGRIDDTNLMIGIRAVWDCSAGLVSNDLSLLMSGILEPAIAGTVERQVWVGKGKLIAVEHNRWEQSVTVRPLVGGKGDTRKEFDSATNPIQTIEAYLARIEETMVRSGLRRVL